MSPDPMSPLPTNTEHDVSDSAHPSRLALWFPVVVSGIAVVTWLGILAWLAYGS